MRKIFISVVVLVLLLSVSSSARLLGHLRTAETSGLGSLNFQSGIGIYENAFTLFGRVVYGLGAGLDGALTVGIVDLEGSDNVDLALAGDFQWQFMDSDFDDVIDMGMKTEATYYSLPGDSHLWSVGWNLIGGKKLITSGGFKLIPYALLNIRLDMNKRTMNKFNPSNQIFEEQSKTDSDFNLGINVGAKTSISHVLEVIAELQFDDQFGVILGFNIFMW